MVIATERKEMVRSVKQEAMLPELLAYWPIWLKAVTVK